MNPKKFLDMKKNVSREDIFIAPLNHFLKVLTLPKTKRYQQNEK